MRGGAFILLLVLSACRSEPDFDERYETAQETIEAKAKSIDEELKAKEKAGRLREESLATPNESD